MSSGASDCPPLKFPLVSTLSSPFVLKVGAEDKEAGQLRQRIHQPASAPLERLAVLRRLLLFLYS